MCCSAARFVGQSHRKQHLYVVIRSVSSFFGNCGRVHSAPTSMWLPHSAPSMARGGRPCPPSQQTPGFSAHPDIPRAETAAGVPAPVSRALRSRRPGYRPAFAQEQHRLPARRPWLESPRNVPVRVLQCLPPPPSMVAAQVASSVGRVGLPAGGAAAKSNALFFLSCRPRRDVGWVCPNGQQTKTLAGLLASPWAAATGKTPGAGKARQGGFSCATAC